MFRKGIFVIMNKCINCSRSIDDSFPRDAHKGNIANVKAYMKKYEHNYREWKYGKM